MPLNSGTSPGEVGITTLAGTVKPWWSWIYDWWMFFLVYFAVVQKQIAGSYFFEWVILWEKFSTFTMLLGVGPKVIFSTKPWTLEGEGGGNGNCAFFMSHEIQGHWNMSTGHLIIKVTVIWQDVYYFGSIAQLFFFWWATHFLKCKQWSWWSSKSPWQNSKVGQNLMKLQEVWVNFIEKSWAKIEWASQTNSGLWRLVKYCEILWFTRNKKLLSWNSF